MFATLKKFSRLSNYAFRKIFSVTKPEFKNLIVDSSDGVFVIGINRPEKRNCVNPETATELISAFKQFEDDTSADVAILHGKGGNFCAGFDLSSLSTADENSLKSFQIDDMAPLGPSRMFIKKPVIAAVEGYCVAGGLELSLLCDLRVAGEDAVFGVFCRRFAPNGYVSDICLKCPCVPLLDGGTVRLQRLIGLSRAMDMILTGRGVKATEAKELGLVNVITENGSALEKAMEIAHEIRKFPQKCLNADRQSAYYAAYNASSIEEALKYEFDNGIHVLGEESVPGARQFTKGVGRHGSFDLKRSNKPKL